MTEADRFMDMPATSQALYLHLYMHADNDGFVESANGVRRMCGATADDLSILAAKGFVTLWPDGVCLVMHWRVGNKLSDSRKFKSKFAARLESFEETQVGEYQKVAGTEADSYGVATESLPDSYGIATASLRDSYGVAPRRGEKRIEEERRDSSLRNDLTVISSDSVGKPDPRRDEVRAVVAYLNAQTGRHFRADSRQTAAAVRARLSEGFTVDDFRRVIDAKVSDWAGDPRMERYLRPSTLFRPSNFEAYANQGLSAAPAWRGRTFDYEEVTVPDDGS